MQSRWFLITAGVIVALMPVAVFLGLREGRAQAEALDARGDLRRAAIELANLLVAEERYRMEARLDADGDHRGEYAPLGALEAAGLTGTHLRLVDEAVLEGDGYRYRALVPGSPDAAERELVIVAMPGDPERSALAIDAEGALYRSPADFSPDPERPIDPRSWPEW